MTPEINVECGDIAQTQCDVLILKFAQSWYGADAHVMKLLSAAGQPHVSPQPGKYSMLASNRAVSPTTVLFIGTVGPSDFSYQQVRELASNALAVLAMDMPSVEHVALTAHGIGFGLDERESVLSELAGLLGASGRGSYPTMLKRITIVERDQSRAARIRSIVDELRPVLSLYGTPAADTNSVVHEMESAGGGSTKKPSIFVAMPFDSKMEDVYGFGIQAPVSAAGYLCEKINDVAFTGDILIAIVKKIVAADLVIADLTGANANVYLEVGLAWGKDKSTLLLVQDIQQLKFDVQSQKCIVYNNITDLSKQLRACGTPLWSQAASGHQWRRR